MQVKEFIGEVYKLNAEGNDVIRPHYHKVIAYTNDDVVEKFIEEFNLPKSEAQSIFTETLKFLYLAHVGHSMGQDAMITDSTMIIDKMWHTFILFTKDYNNFCQKFFGRFLHHQPNSKSMMEARKNSSKKDAERHLIDIENKLKIQLENINKYLDPDTIRKWYVEFEYSYSMDRINALQIPLTKSPIVDDVEITNFNLDNISDLIKKIVIRDTPRVLARLACGCSGKGCGAGCACNSGTFR